MTIGSSFKRAILLLAVAAGAARCALPDPNATVQGACPSRDAFNAVSPFLEDGCGTPDCHGQPSRPLRIFGYYGLRLSPSNYPGDSTTPDTTPAEVDANFEAVCGLQPELMTEVVMGQAAPGSLLLLMKPLDETNHKGGAVILPGSDGETCLTSWLSGAVDAGACQRAYTAMKQP
jgi:hypothetical protein